MKQVKDKDQHIFYFILALIFLRPSLDILTNWQFEIHPSLPEINVNLLIGGLVFVLAFACLLSKYRQTIATPLFIFIIIFLALAAAAVFYAADGLIASKEFVRLATIFLLYFLAFEVIKNKEQFFLLLKVILASYVIPAAAALVQLAFGYGLADDFGGFQRVFGTFAHPNPFAFYTFLIAALLILLVLSKDLLAKEKRAWYWLAAAIVVFLLLATYSRSALFTLLLFIFFFGILKYRKLLIIGMVVFFAGYLLFPAFQERFWQLLNLDPYGSVVWRFRLWKDMLPVAMWHPWLGHGLGSFTEITEFYRGYQFGSLDAHNDYLKIFMENGILGLASYLALACALLWKLWQAFIKAAKQYKTLALGILIIVLSLYGVSLFDNVLRATALQWNLWILLGAWLKLKRF